MDNENGLTRLKRLSFLQLQDRQKSGFLFYLMAIEVIWHRDLRTVVKFLLFKSSICLTRFLSPSTFRFGMFFRTKKSSIGCSLIKRFAMGFNQSKISNFLTFIAKQGKNYSLKSRLVFHFEQLWLFSVDPDHVISKLRHLVEPLNPIRDRALTRIRAPLILFRPLRSVPK